MLMINEDRLLNELIELIKIKSPSKREGHISNVLQEKLRELGLTVIEDKEGLDDSYEAGNLICNLSGDESLTPILFTAHMDTLDIHKEVVPRIDGHYLKSDGTTILGVDNKLGIAVLLETIKVLKENKIAHGPIQFVFTVAEELGLNGARALNKDLLHAKYGYALDHTGDIGHFVTNAMYYATLNMTIKVPALIKSDMSAINIATKTMKHCSLGQVNKETRIEMAEFSGDVHHISEHKYDEAVVTFKINSFHKEMIDKEINHVKETVKRLRQHYTFMSHFKSDFIFDGFHFSEDDELVVTTKRAAESLNLEAKMIKSKNTSDANVLSSLGIPTLNLAVDYEGIHTNNERYDLRNLSKLTNFIIAIIKEVAKKL